MCKMFARAAVYARVHMYIKRLRTFVSGIYELERYKFSLEMIFLLGNSS